MTKNPIRYEDTMASLIYFEQKAKSVAREMSTLDEKIKYFRLADALEKIHHDFRKMVFDIGDLEQAVKDSLTTEGA